MGLESSVRSCTKNDFGFESGKAKDFKQLQHCLRCQGYNLGNYLQRLKFQTITVQRQKRLSRDGSKAFDSYKDV